MSSLTITHYPQGCQSVLDGHIQGMPEGSTSARCNCLYPRTVMGNGGDLVRGSFATCFSIGIEFSFTASFSDIIQMWDKQMESVEIEIIIRVHSFLSLMNHSPISFKSPFMYTSMASSILMVLFFLTLTGISQNFTPYPGSTSISCEIANPSCSVLL